MFKLPKGVIYIVETLSRNGFRSYVVGGSIRDILLEKPVYDWDIATDATPQQIMPLFDKVVPTGIAFGTVTILLEDGDYEVTTFRSDGRYFDGRRPEKVTFSKNIEEDLSRRDFTVNAMAYDPLNDKLVDNFGGKEDIKRKIIRTVGDPEERFSEDGLRSMRACRFAAKLDFEIDEKTFDAISKTVDVFRKVSPERIHDEIIKMLGSDKPSVGIECMRRSGLLKETIPELEEGLNVSQPKPFHAHDVYYHNIYSCDHAPKELPVVRFAALLHDIAKPRCKKDETFYGHESMGAEMAEKIMKRLKFSNGDIEDVANLIKNHMFNYTGDWTDSAVRRFIKRAGLDNLEYLFMLRVADMKAMGREINLDFLTELKSRIRTIIGEDNALTVAQLKVSGQDIMKELDIPPGPKVGEILEMLLEKVLDDPSLNDRGKLLEAVRRSRPG